MNPLSSAVKQVDWRLTGAIVLAVVVGVGAAATAIFQHDGSTTAIEQSGDRGKSHSQVIRDKDGQTIITQDKNSTDITVQRHPDAPSSDDGSEDTTSNAREAFKQRMSERMQRPSGRQESRGE